MGIMKVPHDLQIAIKDFLLYTFSTKDTPQQLQDFLSRIPHSYVIKVQTHVLSQILSQNAHIYPVIQSEAAH